MTPEEKEKMAIERLRWWWYNVPPDWADEESTHPYEEKFLGGLKQDSRILLAAYDRLTSQLSKMKELEK